MMHNFAAVRSRAVALTFFGTAMLVASVAVVVSDADKSPLLVGILGLLSSVGTALLIGGVIAGVIGLAIRPPQGIPAPNSPPGSWQPQGPQHPQGPTPPGPQTYNG